MKIVIDLQAAQTISRWHGIGRYSLSFAKALARNCGQHKIWLLLNSCFPDTIEDLRKNFKDLIPPEHIKVFYSNQPTAEHLNNSFNIKTSKKLREHFINTLSPDIVHLSNLFEGWLDGAVTSIGELGYQPLTSVMLYDLIPVMYEKEYLKDIHISKFYYKKLQNLKRANLILATSPLVRQAAIDMLSISPDQIIHCSSGVSSKFCQKKVNDKDRLELEKLYRINRQFILYVGGFDYRKNTEKLIESFSLLPKKLRTLHQLVIVGKVTKNNLHYIELLKNRYQLSIDELIITHYIPDYHLINLYNLCQLFILPSLHEGFSLPLLEALSCGAVAIASNTISLPELINYKDALFDPTKAMSISEKMITALTNESFREFLKKNGREHAKKFTWDACAKKVLSAFDKLKETKSNVFYGSSYPKSKMAFISPLPPDKTGIAQYSLQLLPELARFYDIVIIVDQAITENKWIVANFDIKDAQWFIKNAPIFDVILYQFGNSPFHYYMLKLFEAFPGIIVLHDFFLSGMLRWADTLFPNENNYIFCKMLYESHGYLSLLNHKQKGSEAALQAYPCNFSILKRAKGIIVHSQHAINLAKKWYNFNNPSYIQKIPQLRLRTHSINRSHAREKLQLTDNDFLICSFGFISPNKLSHRIYLSLMNSEFFKNSNNHLTFVGENNIGEYGDEMNKMIKKNNQKQINITNFVSTELFETYLSAADMAIQLRTQSRGETSACIFSCLDFAIPTIINAHGSLDELPQGTVYKIKENFTDSELLMAINSLYENKSLRCQLSHNALEYSKQHHPSLVAKEYKKIINYFINHNPNYSEKHLINELVENNFHELGSINLMSTVKTIAANRPSLGASQLLIDITTLANLDLRSGIQRVVRGILISLLNNPPDGYRIEPIYLKNGHYHYARSYTMTILGLPTDMLEDNKVEINSEDIFLGLDLCLDAISQARAILKNWHICGIKFYFIIYDFLPILRPEFFPSYMQGSFLSWLELVSEVAHGLICISKQVAKDYLALFKRNIFTFSKLKVGFFHLGSNIDASFPSYDDIPNKDLLQKLSSRKSFLSVGTIEPRKGYWQLINAFSQLWLNNYDINLVIIGQEGWMVDKIIAKILKHPEYGKRLIWLKDASDKTLKEIYVRATALIMASEGEGFGLPLIEAAQYGLSIIARDLPVFREVSNNYAIYFQGLEPSDIAQSIKEWLALYTKGKVPKAKDIKSLTWDESTQMLLKIIFENHWLNENHIGLSPNLNLENSYN